MSLFTRSLLVVALIGTFGCNSQSSGSASAVTGDETPSTPLPTVQHVTSSIRTHGAGSSGGGGAAVCRDQNRNIISARILDLYEGEVRFGYQINQDASSPNDQLVRAISQLPARYQAFVTEIAAGIVEEFQFLPDGVSLAPTTDLGSDYGVVVPDGCSIEPVGFYEMDGTLKVSHPVFSALSNTDQSAFILHEAIYKIARYSNRASDSATSRHLVGALFASNLQTSSIESLVKDVIFLGDTLFVSVQNRSDQYRLEAKAKTSNAIYNVSFTAGENFYFPPAPFDELSGDQTFILIDDYKEVTDIEFFVLPSPVMETCPNGSGSPCYPTRPATNPSDVEYSLIDGNGVIIDQGIAGAYRQIVISLSNVTIPQIP